MRLLIVFISCIGLFACNKQDTAVHQTLAVKSLKDYTAEAEAVVNTVNVSQAMDYVGDESVVFIDLRESAEIVQSGKIEGAVHVPRGVLEFYIEPRSPLHAEVFSSGKKVVLYCATGGRSLLATKVAMEMGLSDAVHLDGGFRAWARAGGAIAAAGETK